MKNQITLELSRYCNYECRHCFISAGPKGESLTTHQVKRIVDHLPDDLRVLILTGGEPFASKPLLYTTLNYLMIRSLSDLEGISIFTNGFWARDKQSINHVIREIKNVSSIPIRLQIGSTRYHREFESSLKTIKGFLKEEGQDQLVKIIIDIDENKWLWNFIAPQLIFPMGRGKRIAGKFNRPVRNFLAPCTARRIGVKDSFNLDDYFLYITNRGDVYGCCPHRHKELGNAIKAPIKNLLLAASQLLYFQALNEGGVKKAALELGLTKEDIKRRTHQKWICDFCEELTNAFFKD